MDIFEHGGLSCQTLDRHRYSVWCYGTGRLIEVARFDHLYDAIAYVDAIVYHRDIELDIPWGEVYSIIEI